MRYTNRLLDKEAKSFDAAKFYGSVFAMLNNEKTLEEYVANVLKLLPGIEGEIVVVKLDRNQPVVLTEDLEGHWQEQVRTSEVWEKVKASKKPYTSAEGDNFYGGYPLNYKGKCIGGLLIKEEQEITCWNELVQALLMLVTGLRYHMMIEQEKELDIKDVLTGLYNEKYFATHFFVEEEKYKRFKTPATLVMVYVENLLEIQNTFNHEVGEEVLKEVAHHIESQVRKIDMPARTDKNAFAVLQRSTPIQGGEALENRVRNLVPSSIKVDGKKVPIQLTVGYLSFYDGVDKETLLKEIYKKRK